MIRAKSKVTLFTLASLTLFGCPMFVDDTCPASYCSGHGECREVKTLPVCTCTEGYQGAACGQCAPGFHPFGNDCVADDLCDDRCGAHGTCSLTGGVASCTCEAGYDGPTCLSCYGEYLTIDPQDGGAVTCVPPQLCNAGSCAPGFSCDDTAGTPVCTCDGIDCSTCTSGLCGANGTCDDSSGRAQCTCQPGYQGAACGSCYPGYSANDAGVCAINERCTATTCSGGGQCDSSSGRATCTCDASHAGSFCERCASGFHRDAQGACVADQQCGPTSCPSTATCSATGGVVSCTCLPGNAGPGCGQCYPGYHRESGACVLDQNCTATSCGRGTCEDGTGVVVCSNCPAGFSGAHCELNTNDCGTACNSGQCIDLVGGFQCLCTDGTWGSSCLPGPTVTGLSPTSGDLRGGTVITLTGTNFVSGSTVDVDGVSATNVQIVSSTSVRATVPAATSLGEKVVRVRAPNAQVGTARFTYTPVTFDFTGGLQTFVVPSGVTSLKVRAWGGGGGAGRGTTVLGGAGGFVSATVAVTAGSSFVIAVGGGGARLADAGFPDGGELAAGAGGGLTGLFSAQLADGGLSQGDAVLIAGGGGGGGFFTTGSLGSSGGNGGGDYGSDGVVVAGVATGTQGLAGSPVAGGIGGCFMNAQCGQTGVALAGGAGGIPNNTTARLGATFGGGGAVGAGIDFFAPGGGGGYWGGGAGSGGGSHGGAGGSGFARANGTTQLISTRSSVAGVPEGRDEPGYVAGRGHGGRAVTPNTTSGGPGLLLISW